MGYDFMMDWDWDLVECGIFYPFFLGTFFTSFFFFYLVFLYHVYPFILGSGTLD
jgi:hypothetical protein